MKYYTIRIQNKKDGSEVRNIAPFDNRDDAEIYFHKCLAADIKGTDIEATLILVLNSEGSVIMSRKWEVEETPDAE